MNIEKGIMVLDKYHHVLCISKIIFESSFTTFLRSKLADILLKFYQLGSISAQLKRMLSLFIEVAGLKDNLNGETFVKAVDKELLNPSFAFTRASCLKNRETYNSKIKLLLAHIRRICNGESSSSVQIE
jgi:hypothetical protein